MSGIDKPRLLIGALLMASFLVVLVAIFLPLFDGATALDTLDNLYNSISKASAYYIPKLQHEVDEVADEEISLTLELPSPSAAQRAAALLASAGVSAQQSGSEVALRTAFDQLLSSCLADSDDVYHNRDEAIVERRSMAPKAAMHSWWQILGELDKELRRNKAFPQAKLADSVRTKVVEAAFNYHGIEPQPISERWMIVVLSLVFYVVYTIWYGYAVLFLFEGLGFRLGDH
jgi:hypothetical protein